MLSRSAFVSGLFLCACMLPCSAQQLVTDIPLSGTPNGIAVNPNNNRIYVSLESSSVGPAVAVIDGTSNSVIDTIATPSGSNFVAVNSTTGRVYNAGCTFNSNSACAVTVIDGKTDAVITTIPLAGSNGVGVQGIAVNPVTNQIYVSDDMNFKVAVIHGSTNTVSYINTQNTEMLGLAVDIGTNELIGAPSGGVIDVFNIAKSTFTQIPVGTINQDVAVNPFTSRAYVTDDAGTAVGVVSLRTNQVLTNINVSGTPFGVCVDYLSNLVFVSVGQNVVIIDGKSNQVSGTVNAPSIYLDVNPVTRLVYASSSQNQAVHVISE